MPPAACLPQTSSHATSGICEMCTCGKSVALIRGADCRAACTGTIRPSRISFEPLRKTMVSPHESRADASAEDPAAQLCGTSPPPLSSNNFIFPPNCNINRFHAARLKLKLFDRFIDNIIIDFMTSSSSSSSYFLKLPY